MLRKRETSIEEKYRNLFINYIVDRKAVILLIFIHSFIFIIVCSLYQIHNLSRIMYATLLSLFIWSCFGTIDFLKYVQKQKRIRMAKNHPELALEALQNGSLLSNMDKAYESLIEELSRLIHSLETESELRRTEMADYYMMWAHQIKTPIAAMKLLLNGKEDGFLLMEELFKIEQYVEMVLHYLRLESIASDMVLGESDLYSLVKQTVRKYSILFINSGLSLQLEEFDVKVLTDEKWLGFVLEQIISNSIKYTRKGTISIYLEKSAQKTLVIEDTGIGIRQEDLPRIFDRGFTGYNGRMDKKSTGIGLYLCKQIMNQLSHGVFVSSEEGKGAKFYLDLSRDSYA